MTISLGFMLYYNAILQSSCELLNVFGQLLRIFQRDEFKHFWCVKTSMRSWFFFIKIPSANSILHFMCSKIRLHGKFNSYSKKTFSILNIFPQSDFVASSFIFVVFLFEIGVVVLISFVLQNWNFIRWWRKAFVDHYYATKFIIKFKNTIHYRKWHLKSTWGSKCDSIFIGKSVWYPACGSIQFVDVKKFSSACICLMELMHVRYVQRNPMHNSTHVNSHRLFIACMCNLKYDLYCN